MLSMHGFTKKWMTQLESSWHLLAVVRYSHFSHHSPSTTDHLPRPIAPAPLQHPLSALQNGRVRVSCSLRRRVRPQRTCEPHGPPAFAPAQSSVLTMCSWIFRENNVPHYQREFQKHDGVRLWQKVRSAEGKATERWHDTADPSRLCWHSQRW